MRRSLAEKAITILETLNCYHSKMFHPEKGTIIPIPMHKGKNVSVGIIREIINEIGVSREEWLEL